MIWLTVWAGCLAAQLSAATIGFQVNTLGTNSFRYNYFVSGVTFSPNQELDIQFAPNVYGTLSNGQAPGGFNLLLIQPNNPPGTAGEYSALALMNNPSLAGTFSVDFTLLPGQSAGSQPFVIGSFNPLGGFNQTMSGVTVLQGSSGAPEPTSLSLAGLGLLIGTGWWAARRAGNSRQ